MKDCCGQEIEPIKDRLSIHTNRHPSTSGYSWGWIEGCSKRSVGVMENRLITKKPAPLSWGTTR
jgi:hypothetical protein